MSRLYPNIEKLDKFLNVHDMNGNEVVFASDLESRLEGIRVAYGFGNKDVGSVSYGPDLKQEGFDKKCLIIQLEDTKEVTAETIAEEIESKSDYWLQSAEGVQELKRLAEKLAAKVLR